MGQRIYKTVDGEYVPEGDPHAAFLAFGEGDEVPADVAKQVKPEAKKSETPANKAKKPEGNK